MFNVDPYRAEIEYRQESLRRDFRPLFARRAAKRAARNQIDSGRPSGHGG